jgi:hypothetical protein
MPFRHRATGATARISPHAASRRYYLATHDTDRFCFAKRIEMHFAAPALL